MADAAQAQAPVEPTKAAASIDEQIAAAIEVGKKADATAKGKDTKLQNKVEKSVATKREPAKAEPAEEPEESAEEVQEAEAEETDSNEGEEKPKKHRFLSQAKLREILEEEGPEAAFEAAFGKKPQDFNINSKRWEEWRKANQRTKRQFAEKEQQLVDYHQRLQSAASQLKSDFGGFMEARQLAEKGDVAGALKAAFGWDASEFNKRLIRSMQGDAARDPAVDELKRELLALREERQREREDMRREIEQRQIEQSRQNYRTELRQELTRSGDRQLQSLAKKEQFLDHIITIQRDHYDPDTRTTLPVLEAADMARQAILDEFGDVIGAPRDEDDSSESGRGGSIPAKATARAVKTLSQRGAAEASPPLKNGKAMSVDELADYFAEQHRTAIGKSPVRQRA